MGRFLLRAFDFVEEGGRRVQRSAVKAGILAGAGLGAGLIGAAGFAVLIVSLFLGIQPQLGPAGAAAICGVALLVIAAAMALIVRHLAK